MRILVWLLRAFIFFALFAFALNNQQAATVHWFFGVRWQAPMVIVVLAAFAGGCALGVLAMVPAWWKHRRDAKRLVPGEPVRHAPAALPAVTAASDFGPDHPPREGL
jgi:lipopolysaccharide assembly protein A